MVGIIPWRFVVSLTKCFTNTLHIIENCSKELYFIFTCTVSIFISIEGTFETWELSTYKRQSHAIYLYSDRCAIAMSGSRSFVSQAIELSSFTLILSHSMFTLKSWNTWPLTNLDKRMVYYSVYVSCFQANALRRFLKELESGAYRLL